MYDAPAIATIEKTNRNGKLNAKRVQREKEMSQP